MLGCFERTLFPAVSRAAAGTFSACKCPGSRLFAARRTLTTATSRAVRSLRGNSSPGPGGSSPGRRLRRYLSTVAGPTGRRLPEHC